MTFVSLPALPKTDNQLLLTRKRPFYSPSLPNTRRYIGFLSSSSSSPCNSRRLMLRRLDFRATKPLLGRKASFSLDFFLHQTRVRFQSCRSSKSTFNKIAPVVFFCSIYGVSEWGRRRKCNALKSRSGSAPFFCRHL